MLFAFPGSPMVYYGDEAGMEGWEDPFNRGSYPWGKEDADLKAHFTLLASLRKAHPALQKGTIRYLAAQDGLLVFARELDGKTLICAVNAGEAPEKLTLPWNGVATDLLSGTQLTAQNGVLTHYLLPRSGMLLL
jgi:glycosidase